jgi:hypothetical protein
VATGPNADVGDVNFELKSSLINMVQASPFCGKPNEDANAHLQSFLELYKTVTIRGVMADIIRLRLFPFSLLGKVKQWFYQNTEAVDMWDKCSAAFLTKFFPLGKTNALRGRISSFQQTGMESIPDAWERLQEYILTCVHHGMDEWLVLQIFYNGLRTTSRAHLDIAAGGAYLDLTIVNAKALIEKMVANQGWNEERSQPRTKGRMHTIKETNMLTTRT